MWFYLLAVIIVPVALAIVSYTLELSRVEEDVEPSDFAVVRTRRDRAA